MGYLWGAGVSAGQWGGGGSITGLVQQQVVVATNGPLAIGVQDDLDPEVGYTQVLNNGAGLGGFSSLQPPIVGWDTANNRISFDGLTPSRDQIRVAIDGTFDTVFDQTTVTVRLRLSLGVDIFVLRLPTFDTGAGSYPLLLPEIPVPVSPLYIGASAQIQFKADAGLCTFTPQAMSITVIRG